MRLCCPLCHIRNDTYCVLPPDVSQSKYCLLSTCVSHITCCRLWRIQNNIYDVADVECSTSGACPTRRNTPTQPRLDPSVHLFVSFTTTLKRVPPTHPRLIYSNTNEGTFPHKHCRWKGSSTLTTHRQSLADSTTNTPAKSWKFLIPTTR